MPKNVHRMLKELKVTPSNVLLFPSNSPKPKDIQFIMIWNRENWKILTFEKLEPDNGFINYLNHSSIIKIDNFSVYRLTN